MGAEREEDEQLVDGKSVDRDPAIGADRTPTGLPRSVRHGLRSAIGQVIGYTELWLDELDEEGSVGDIEALRRDLVRIREAGRQVLDVVNEYIDPIGRRARSLESEATSEDSGCARGASPYDP